MRKNIIVVDKKGKFLNEETLENTIRKKLIRRVARIFVFNRKGELFLQKRSMNVGAWPGRWDNSAGGFMDPGETIEQTAKRELEEELGITAPVTKLFDFHNEEAEDGHIVFRNFETVFTAQFEGPIKMDKDEIAGGQWKSIQKISLEMQKNPRDFSPGFIHVLQKYLNTKKNP